MKTSSWVIVSRETGNPVFETFSREVVNDVNQKKFFVIPALEWLRALNGMNKYHESAAKIHLLRKIKPDGGMLTVCGEKTILRKDSITADREKVNCFFCRLIKKQNIHEAIHHSLSLRPF